jgi:dipeptidyl aminopeptidase/acylaminoacyl peptidase
VLQRQDDSPPPSRLPTRLINRRPLARAFRTPGSTRRRALFATCLLIAAAASAAANPPTPPAAAPSDLATNPTAAPSAPPPVVPPRIAAEVFAKPSSYTGMQLSPSGTQVVARAIVNDTECLVVRDLETGKARLISLPAKVELVWFGWAGDDRILFSFGSGVRWFDRDAYATRLIAYDLRTDKPVFIGRRDGGLEGDDVLYVDPAGEWLLLALQRTPYEYPAVFRADLGTGALREVVDAQRHVWDWYADRAGVVRTGIGYRGDSWFMVYRKSADEKFRRTAGADYGDRATLLDMLSLIRDSDEGFLLSDEKTGRLALYRYNFATGALGELVFESPTNDIDDFSLSEDGRSVVSVEYVDDRQRTAWLDPTLRTHQDRIDGTLPGRMNHFVSRSQDGKRFLVWSGAANDPGSYYLYVPGNALLKQVAVVHDGLNPAQLPATAYTGYPARDGLEIPAYLTLPLGREPKGLPLVVMPHGGPYGVRDELGYDNEVQFLANRGYAVLQPNYRGSAGYGAGFYQQGQGQWGRRMQDDLDDGVDWLVGQGIVDPKRVCLVGSSYGGYAALWGATRNPERYRCAASFAGVTDVGRQLKYQLNSFGDRRGRKDWRSTVEGEDGFDLDSISPYFGVAGLRVPVLLAHGEQDQIVPVRQSEMYASALKKAGKAHEHVVYPGEGHGLSDADNLADWLRRLEVFLARHNPAD